MKGFNCTLTEIIVHGNITCTTIKPTKYCSDNANLNQASHYLSGTLSCVHNVMNSILVGRTQHFSNILSIGLEVACNGGL